ncbi:hypothetical protein EBQ74_13420 [bacterium]|nr:hypothetical protein [bacterium]
MKWLWIFSILLLTPELRAALDPVELKAKVAAVYMSKSAYCTSPILVFSKSNVLAYDVFGFPTLGILDNQSREYDESYQCLIIKMSEQYSFRANILEGNCSMSNSHTANICTASHTNTAIDGSSSSCSAAADETVYVYLSTASNSNDPDVATQPFSPPTAGDTTRGVKLTSPFVVNGNVSGRFIIDATARINNIGGSCTLSMPKFSFVKE